MRRLRRAILILLSYILAFAAAAGAASLVVNQDKVSGAVEFAGSSLPVVYVRTAGQLMNEMHGYVMEVDAGYYRDTLTAVGDSKTINLSLYEYGYDIISGSYELYNDRYDTLIESGECTEPELSSGMLQMQIVFDSTLRSNTEYCLRIMLCDSQESIINYYTRVRYGSDLKVGEKLQFVLDFNEATFDSDNGEELEHYLETDTAGSSNYSKVTLKSTTSEVTWGSLDPVRTGDISIRLKEINTETAAFTLFYTVESSAGNVTSKYEVEEYYRIRWTSDQIYLLDFERTMHENISDSEFGIENGTLRIGICDSDDVVYGMYGTQEQEYVYLQTDGKLWVLDSTGRIMTLIWTDEDEGHSCSRQYQTGIKVIYTDDVSGDIYFIVYGYMHSGVYEGYEGVTLYHFRQAEVMLEELMFIPYEKGFAQLEAGIESLAYMNDNGVAWLMIDDSVYSLDTASGRMSRSWTGLTSVNFRGSSSGFMAYTDGEDEYAGDHITVADLDTGRLTQIREEGYLVAPLGYIEGDFIYGLIDPGTAPRETDSGPRIPMSSIRIVDSDMNEVKTYESPGLYITGIGISDNYITIGLAAAADDNGHTYYTDAGSDYIVHNSGADRRVQLESVRDSVRGIQNWLRLDTEDTFDPVIQTVRYIEPGYDISKEYEGTGEIELKYYVYTKGRLAAVFDTVGEAVDYGNENAGTVMTSHKQILWQRAGRAYVWDLDIDSIEQADDDQNTVLIQTIASYEGWDIAEEIDDSIPLFEAMNRYLPAECIDLGGIEMTDVLHFVYRDRVVAGKISDDSYALIIAYDNQYVRLADPGDGRVYWMTWSSAKKLFEEYGNTFYSYID